MAKNDNLLFLNSPICNNAEDIIGISSYVKKLSDAIDADAQMIAITSKFGAGKTSIIELLQKERKKEEEKFIHISMWSHLCDNNSVNDSANNPVNDLHRAFVYQLASQINHKKGTYINRRLSKNYGLLKLSINRPFYSWLTVFALLCAAASWGINVFPRITSRLHSLIADNIPAVTTILLFLAITTILFVLSQAEIIISSNKSEGGRILEPDEITDIYRTEILERKPELYHKVLKHMRLRLETLCHIKFSNKRNKYIV